MYYTQMDLKPEDITIQEDELTEVRWFSIEELEEMVKTKELNQNQVDFFLKCCKYLNKKNNEI